MEDVKFEFKGYNRVQNKLRRLAADNPSVSDPIVRAFAQEQRAKLKSTPYPEQKNPDSRYTRTGRLANSWGVLQMAPGQYALRNSATYSGWVVGQFQARIHKGHWWQAKDIVAENMPILVTRLTAAYLKLWGS